MSEEMNTSSRFNFFGVDLPKIDLPKIDLPTLNMPAVHMDGVNTAIDAVKSAAKDGYTSATEAATKVRKRCRSHGHSGTRSNWRLNRILPTIDL